MCFAFRKLISTADQTLDQILSMTKIMRASTMHHSAPPSTRAQSTPASGSSDSTDCVVVEPPKKVLSTNSRTPISTQRNSTVELAESKNGVEHEEGEDDEYQDMEDSVAAAAPSRKRRGSSLGKSSVKKVKTSVSSKRQEPSGKGDDYDDLRDRANIKVRQKQETIDHLTSEMEDMQGERDQALTTVSHLQKRIASQRVSEAAKEAREAADLKAAVQEMKVTLKAEMEKKHRSNDKVKSERHKEEMARSKSKTEEAVAAAKDAKALAKELEPAHSGALQAREKKIDRLEENIAVLEAIADKLKAEKAKIEADKAALSEAIEQQGVEIIALQGTAKELKNEVNQEQAVSASHSNEMARMKRDFAANRRSWDEKWQIQYENAQNSARRASDIQRSVSTVTRALNEVIVNRDEFQIKLKGAEAETRILRNSISKGEGSDHVVQG